MIRLLAYIVAGMASVLIVGTVFGERLVDYEDQAAVLIFGALLGLLTFFIKPVVTAVSVVSDISVQCSVFSVQKEAKATKALKTEH